MRIAICDDMSIVVHQLNTVLTEVVHQVDFPYTVDTFTSGDSFLRAREQEGEFDIVFLDIEIGDMNGIEIARTIRQENYDCLIIFISQYDKYYKAAFDVQPFHFLDKPVSREKILNILKRAGKVLNRDINLLSFTYERTCCTVPLSQILYLASEKRKVHLYTKSEEYCFYDKLDNIEKRISELHVKFLRIHQSYLVNPVHIRKFSPGSVTLWNGIELPVSDERRKEAIKIYMELLAK